MRSATTTSTKESVSEIFSRLKSDTSIDASYSLIELIEGKIEWFTGGKTNASYNSLDVHIQAGHGDKVAFIWEGDEIGDEKTITYSEFHKLTCKVANVLKSKNILTGDSLG